MVLIIIITLEPNCLQKNLKDFLNNNNNNNKHTNEIYEQSKSLSQAHDHILLIISLKKIFYYLTVETVAEIMKKSLTRTCPKVLKTATDSTTKTLSNFVWCCENVFLMSIWIIGRDLLRYHKNFTVI